MVAKIKMEKAQKMKTARTTKAARAATKMTMKMRKEANTPMKMRRETGAAAKMPMKAARGARTKLALEEKLLVGIVAVSTLMIFVAFLVELLPTPSERADAELAEMADGYYLTYLYPRVLGTNRDLNQAFAKYDTAGMPTVLLRHLLHYSEDYAEKGEAFEAVGCNTDTTGVRYYPKAPYGPHDYEVEYRWVCTDKDTE